MRFLIIALSLLSAELSSADDWPRMLGARGDQTSIETNLNLNWGEAPPPQLWKVQAGDSYSPPVIASDRVIHFHRIADAETIDCLDAKTGQRLWRQDYPTSYADRYGYANGPRCSPIIHDGKVYTLGSQAVLTCLSFDKGQIIWQRKLGEELKVPQSFFGTGATPIIAGENLLMNLGAPDGHGIVAINRKNGKTAWHSSDDLASYAMPALATLNGQNRALFFTRAGLVLVDPENGKVLHRYPFRSKTHESVNAATPVVINNSIFLSSCYRVGAVSLSLREGKLVELWKNVDSMQNHWATSLHHKGNLYGFHGRHGPNCVLRCLDYSTGKVRWESPTGLGRSTGVRVGDHYIVLGERGDLALVKLSPKKYIEKARHRILNYPSWAPPAISNGRLFLRSNTTLLCLDLSKKDG